ETPNSDELRLDLPLELAQLGDLARLDELSKPRLDAGSDPAQLPHPSRADELRHGRLRRADELRRAPVGASAVVAGSREVEQRGERLDPLGDRGVVEVSGSAH